MSDCPYLYNPKACRKHRHRIICSERLGEVSRCTNCKTGIENERAAAYLYTEDGDCICPKCFEHKHPNAFVCRTCRAKMFYPGEKRNRA